MALKTFSTARDFFIKAETYLKQHIAEARIHYRVTVMNAAREEQRTDQFFAANVENGDVVGNAVCTPPWKGLLSGIWGDCMEELVRSVHGFSPFMPGIMGPPSEAVQFANSWCDLTDTHPTQGVSETWYALEAVTMPRETPGAMVTASEADLDLVISWLKAFWAEAGLHDALDAQAHGERAVALGLFHLWCVDGKPVAMAGHSGPIGDLVSIGPVYTSPDHRRHGYGANLVAHLSKHFLDSGVPCCGLGADRENPNSNRIYQRMGYYEVAQMEEIRFIGPLD